MFRLTACLTVPFFLLMSAVAVPTPVTSSRVAVAHDTSAVNCTEAECAYDVKVCNKASDSCKMFINCLEDHCSDSKVNDTKSDQCFVICLFQVDADGPTMELMRCAMETCIHLSNGTTVDRV